MVSKGADVTVVVPLPATRSQGPDPLMRYSPIHVMVEVTDLSSPVAVYQPWTDMFGYGPPGWSVVNGPVSWGCQMVCVRGGVDT